MDTTASLVYKGGLSCEITHTRSGSLITTDAPLDNNGLGRTFSPTDLMTVSLASCIMTIMGIKAREMEIDITGSTVDIKKHMASDPRRISKIEMIFQMSDNGLSDKEKSILEKVAHHCPVGRSIHPDLEEAVVFIWAK